MTHTITYIEKQTPELAEILSKGIADYCKQKKGLEAIETFAFALCDKMKSVKGGCCGVIYYGCLYVDMLWVDESLRDQNYGTELMKAAETLGKEKGCLFSTVNTMDWEALDFYRKLGYQVEFERHGYLKDSVFYFLRKELI